MLWLNKKERLLFKILKYIFKYTQEDFKDIYSIKGVLKGQNRVLKLYKKYDPRIIEKSSLAEAGKIYLMCLDKTLVENSNIYAKGHLLKDFTFDRDFCYRLMRVFMYVSEYDAYEHLISSFMYLSDLQLKYLTEKNISRLVQDE